MKKVNNRGFILVETVVVGVIVLSIFVMIYQNLVPAVGDYETRIHYDDIDSVYAANMFFNLLNSDTNYSSIMSLANSNGYVDLTDCSKFSTQGQAICNALKTQFEFTSTNRIILGKIPYTQVVSISNLPRGFLDYVKYLQDTTEVTTGYTLLVSRSVTYTDRVNAGKTITVNHYGNMPV